MSTIHYGTIDNPPQFCAVTGQPVTGTSIRVHIKDTDIVYAVNLFAVDRYDRVEIENKIKVAQQPSTSKKAPKKQES